MGRDACAGISSCMSGCGWDMWCSVSSAGRPVALTIAILNATSMGNSRVQHVFKSRGERVGMEEGSGPQCVLTRC